MHRMDARGHTVLMRDILLVSGRQSGGIAGCRVPIFGAPVLWRPEANDDGLTRPCLRLVSAPCHVHTALG